MDRKDKEKISKELRKRINKKNREIFKKYLKARHEKQRWT